MRPNPLFPHSGHLSFVACCIVHFLAFLPSQAQHHSSQRSYSEIKQTVRQIMLEKNQLVNKYLRSSRDRQIAYEERVASVRRTSTPVEMKLLARVATSEEMYRLDSLETLLQKLRAELRTMPDENGVYDVVDQASYPQEGFTEFYRFIAQKLHYPPAARQRKIEGKVYAQVVVDEFGAFDKIEILKGLGSGCDREVLRVLGKVQRWVPGQINGHAVRSRVMLPITFRLQNDSDPGSVENFVVSDDIKSYQEVKQALQEIGRLKAQIMQKHYTSSRDLQLAYQAEIEQWGNEEEQQTVDESLLHSVLTAKEIARLRQLSELRDRLRTKLKYYPNREGVFEVVDQAPKPATGYHAFYADLGKQLRYPKQALERGVEGKVYVRLTVDKDGTMETAQVMKGIGGGCDAEALRALRKVSSWLPALTDDRPVKAAVVVPVVFALQDEKRSKK